MNTLEIQECMKSYKYFAGVYPRDKIKEIKTSSPFGIIVNTDSSFEKGEHWIAILISNKCGEYFDPFGIPPIHKDFINFLNEKCLNGWTFNSITIQHFKSKSCGNFCINYLKSRFRGESFSDFISKFSVNLKYNENILNNGI